MEISTVISDDAALYCRGSGREEVKIFLESEFHSMLDRPGVIWSSLQEFSVVFRAKYPELNVTMIAILEETHFANKDLTVEDFRRHSKEVKLHIMPTENVRWMEHIYCRSRQ